MGLRALQVADSSGVTTTADTIGGVAVLRIGPSSYELRGRTLLYLHVGGHEAVLVVYEGMPHVFLALAPMVPETPRRDCARGGVVKTNFANP